MANLARLSIGRPMSRKGMARPMQAQGSERRATAEGAVTWLPSAMRRLHTAAQGVARTPAQRIRISTRLHPDLHHVLKTHAAAARRTQQSIVVQALEDYLVHRGEIPQTFGDRRTPGPR